MNAFGAAFLAAVAVSASVRCWLGLRHMRHVAAHRVAVPAEFSGQINLESHQRAADYTCAKTRLALASGALEVAIALGLTFGGGLEWLHHASAALFSEGIARGLTLMVLTMLVMTLAELPFSLYSTFRVEARFGFNRSSAATFFGDRLKGLLLGALIGVPLLYAAIYLMGIGGALTGNGATAPNRAPGLCRVMAS